MPIHCHGETHGFIGASRVCVCGASVLTFNGYTPNPHHPRASQLQPQPQPANEVPLSVFKAARAVNATHLAADGQHAYCERYGETLMAKWNEWEQNFGAWLVIDSLPPDAVKVE